MKIGFTGTREGMTQHQKEQFVLKMYALNPTEFHHGDCVGADAEAHDIVAEFFPMVKIHVHPPFAKSQQAFKRGYMHYPPTPYLERDEEIVNMTEYLFGAPKSNIELKRSGTWYTIRYARRLNKPITVLER